MRVDYVLVLKILNVCVFCAEKYYTCMKHYSVYACADGLPTLKRDPSTLKRDPCTLQKRPIYSQKRPIYHILSCHIVHVKNIYVMHIYVLHGVDIYAHM